MSHSSRITRRRFLKNPALPASPVRFRRTHFWSHPMQPTSATVKDRAPLHPAAFTLLPLGSVALRAGCAANSQIQANGLSGHLDETWPDVGPNSGWLGGTGESWERGPYFLDGLIPLAWLLDDARLKAKAQKYIDWTLTHQAANGMFGPAATTTGGRAS